MTTHPCLRSIRIQGYRPFQDFIAPFDSLEVIVGTNGSGKSSLFEFFKFLRNGVYQEFPTEIITGSIGQQIFHVPGPEKFGWNVEIEFPKSSDRENYAISYQGELLGPIGRPHVAFEQVQSVSTDRNKPYLFMEVKEQQGSIQDKSRKQEVALKRPNQLALSTMTNPALETLYNLREYILGWRFYSPSKIDSNKIRKAVPVEQEPVLRESAGNLSAVLFYLQSEYPAIFDELQFHLRSVVPGFKGLTVKARGGPGEVIAFWKESGVETDLTLADLSDGILRLICWITLCIQPNPPSLICIDEPDQGVHPRTLPLLAGLFEKATERTQLFVATHASYFLMQFDIARIAVMKKVNGEAIYIKPKDSETLQRNLEDFGAEEIELMHRNDELELLA
jgi:predicted ATPase